MPESGHCARRALAVCVVASLVTAQPMAQKTAASPTVDLKSVLDEVQPLTMGIDNKGLRAFGLLEIARIRQPTEPAQALELAQLVARNLHDVPGNVTFGDLMKDTFSPMNLLNMFMTTLVYGPTIANINSNNRSMALQRDVGRQRQNAKASLTSDLFELLLPSAPDVAFRTEPTLQPAYRAIALEVLLRKGFATTDLVGAAEELVRKEGDDIPPFELAMLADAMNRHNPVAARAILDRSLKKAHDRDTPVDLLQAIYERALSIDPEFDADSSAASGGRDERISRQLALARASAPVNPRRALAVLGRVTHDSATARQGVAAAVRVIAASAPETLWPEVREAAIRSADDGVKRSNFVISRDAIVALGRVDTTLASQRASSLVTRDTRVSGNTVRLELALSWLSRRTPDALQILESLDDEYWKLLGETAWKIASISRIKPDLFSAIVRAKREWPRQAALTARTDPARAAQTLRRFVQVARILDATAVRYLARHVDEHNHLRDQWVEYLPLALAEAAAAKLTAGDADAHAVLAEADKTGGGAKRPAREWAFAWTAAAWHRAAPPATSRIVELTIQELSRFEKHGNLETHILLFIEQVASFSPTTALQLARRLKRDQKPMGLLAVAWELHGQRER